MIYVAILFLIWSFLCGCALLWLIDDRLTEIIRAIDRLGES